MAYQKTIQKSILSIDDIAKVISMASNSSVKSLTDKCGIPLHTYYAVIKGKSVKSEYIDKIISTLEKY